MFDGVRMPPDIIIFKASSILIAVMMTSFFGTNNKKPVVGLGAVEINTFIKGSEIFC